MPDIVTELKNLYDVIAVIALTVYKAVPVFVLTLVPTSPLVRQSYTSTADRFCTVERTDDINHE